MIPPDFNPVFYKPVEIGILAKEFKFKFTYMIDKLVFYVFKPITNRYGTHNNSDICKRPTNTQARNHRGEVAGGIPL